MEKIADDDEIEVHFLLTNCLFNYPDHSDKIVLKIRKFNITLSRIEDYDKIAQALMAGKYEVAFTAKLIVNAKKRELPEVYEIMHRVTTLLTLAKANFVMPLRRKYYCKGQLLDDIPVQILTPRFNSEMPLIEDYPQGDLQYFIEHCYEKLVIYENDFALGLISQICVIMKSHPIIQIRCLMGFEILDWLGSNAQEYYKIESKSRRGKIEGFYKFLEQNDVPQELREKIVLKFEKNIYANPLFPENIERLVSEWGLQKCDKNEQKLFGLRKEIIHRGNFSSGNSPLDIFLTLVHFIDRLLIGMLCYDGKYTDARKNERFEIRDKSLKKV